MTAPTIYDIGDSPTVTVEFRTAAEVLADPATVTFKLRTPAGVETTYVSGVDVTFVSSTATGYWDFKVPIFPAGGDGTYAVRAFGDVGATIRPTASETKLIVRPTLFDDPL